MVTAIQNVTNAGNAKGGQRGGKAPRNAATSRGNQTPTQPEAPEMAAIGSETVREAIASMKSIPQSAARPNAFTMMANKQLSDAKEKEVALQEAKQTLAQAVDLYREGGDRLEEANSLAAIAGQKLYQARINGLASADTVTGLLGDQFGFKKKGDGSTMVPAGHKEASKTPFGQGETIRKRIVRLVQASEFVAGRDGGRFFDGLEPTSATEGGTTVEQVLRAVEKGDMSLFTAYDRLSDIKRTTVERKTPAFNPKAVAALVSALSGPDAVEAFRANPDLVEAYGAMTIALTVIGEALAEGDAQSLKAA